MAKRSTQSSSSFTLAVHSVRKIDIQGHLRYLATDPAGLSAALILCHRHGLGLPIDDNVVSDAEEEKLEVGEGEENIRGHGKNVRFLSSPHSIVPMSYLAAQDNQLPILVESTGVTTKCVTSSAQIILAVANHSFSGVAIERTLNSFLDSLQTLWVFTLLHEISFSGTAVLHGVFQNDKDSSLSLLDCIKLLEDIQGWCSFKDKYSHLYPTQIEVARSPSTLVGLLVSGGSQSFASDSFKKAYAADIAEFFKTLPLFAEYIQTKGHESSTSGKDGEEEANDEGTDILQIKLASFVLACIYFLPENSVLRGLLIKDHAKLIKWCEQILLKY